MKKGEPSSTDVGVIVDTSVWIEHEKKADPALVDLIEKGRVVLHWAVLGELTVGNIKNRESYLRDLSYFPLVEEFSPKRVFQFIEREKLFGKDLSLVDCILLYDSSQSHYRIYSREKRLNSYIYR